ncbi:hypothetical protein HMPREF3101_06550 [Corynebacterium sp. HMSC29G08]|nr:hypothetical protein HMPREF3101_06550 [Corynebacterium sp. HMSC29G08]
MEGELSAAAWVCGPCLYRLKHIRVNLTVGVDDFIWCCRIRQVFMADGDEGILNHLRQWGTLKRWGCRMCCFTDVEGIARDVV